MKISILTIAPEQFGSLGEDHVISRAQQLGELTLRVADIRDYAEGSFRAVDDSPYGGGAGMILRAAPVAAAIRDCREEGEETCVVIFSPIGERYTQKTAADFARLDHLILVCGHFEGIDARVFPMADRVVSMGDYILSGGEIGAMAVADSVARLLPGVLKRGSLEEESFTGGLLEYPQYTRPAEFEGMQVPPVLLSGDHAAILAWRREKSLELTRRYRPDLLEEPGGE